MRSTQAMFSPLSKQTRLLLTLKCKRKALWLLCVTPKAPKTSNLEKLSPFWSKTKKISLHSKTTIQKLLLHLLRNLLLPPPNKLNKSQLQQLLQPKAHQPPQTQLQAETDCLLLRLLRLLRQRKDLIWIKLREQALKDAS